MFQKPRIGVDVDGVIAESNITFLSYINMKHGTRFEAHDVKDYWYESLGLPDKDIRAAWDFIHKNGLMFNAPTIKDSNLFNMLPGDVSLVTHRDIQCKQATLDWLYKYDFYRHSNCYFVKGPKSQTGMWDYFIEDCPDNVWDLSPKVNKMILVYTHPYNKHMELPKNAMHVNSWIEIHDFFKFETLKGKEDNG